MAKKPEAPFSWHWGDPSKVLERRTWQEPEITINGHVLNSAQAMAIRVAIENFDSELRTDGLGEDDHGKQMAKLYRQRATEIRDFIFGPIKESKYKNKTTKGEVNEALFKPEKK